MNPSKSTQTPCNQSSQFDIFRKGIVDFHISDAAPDFAQKLYASTETFASDISWIFPKFRVDTVLYHLWIECYERTGGMTCLYVRSGCAMSSDSPRTAGATGKPDFNAQISSLLRLQAFPFFAKCLRGAHVWGEKNQIVVNIEWKFDSTIKNLLQLCDSALTFAANDSIPKILLAADFEKNENGEWVEGETRKRKMSFGFMKLFVAVQNNNAAPAFASANASLLLNICGVVPVDILRVVSKLIC